MKSQIFYDWKKAASTVADDYAVEKAFMDQAYAAVQNKCGPLMRPPHQIGFEIVHKNDNATRMVGIFGFRAGRQLFYAPVFFLSGEIKGTDLLYRHMTKTFVPNDEDWVTYLISKARREVGRGIDRRESQRFPSRIRFDTLAYPPMMSGGYGKRASTLESPDTVEGAVDDDDSQYWTPNLGEAPSASDDMDESSFLSNSPVTMRDILNQQLGIFDFNDDDSLAALGADDLDRAELAMWLAEGYGLDEDYAQQLLDNPDVTVNELMAATAQKQANYGAPSGRRLSAAWDRWLDEMTEIPKLEGPGLRDFLIRGGAKMATKLASLMEQSIEFATEVVRNYEPVDWMPEELVTLAKQASDAHAAWAQEGRHETVLSLRYDGPACPELFKFGFALDDARQRTQLNPIYAKMFDQIQQATRPGIWRLLMADGSTEQVFVGYRSDRDFESRSPISVHPDDSYRQSYEDPRQRSMVITRLGGNKASCEVPARKLHGMPDDEAGRPLDNDAFVEEMSVGSGYRALNPNEMSLSEPFVVRAKRKRGSVVEYDVAADPWNEVTLIVNPDSQRTNMVAGVFGNGAKFLRVGVQTDRNTPNDKQLKFHSDITPGDENSLDDWLTHALPVKEASLKLDHATDRFYLSYDGRKLDYLTKSAVAVALTRDLKLHAEDAFAMLDTALETGHCRVDVWNKQAAQLSLRNLEDYMSYTDPDFGLSVEPPQAFALETIWNAPTMPEPRVGDAWDPTYGNDRQNEPLTDEQLLTLPPEQIAQMSNEGQTPAVFEHGVIGSLINAFDATTLVKDYLPKLEEGVDVLGRTLFLFYWKPTDFEMAYGADDMSQLENQFLSSFKSLGKVLLELLKRAKDKPQINAGAV